MRQSRGRVKTLMVVDDCSKGAVQFAVVTSIPALYVTRVVNQVKAERGLPKVIRTDLQRWRRAIALSDERAQRLCQRLLDRTLFALRGALMEWRGHTRSCHSSVEALLHAPSQRRSQSPHA
jgi:hypothetical protein